ncbi:hypothetical protein KJZ99_02200 [bacterium]|nr:hypothetical protein [bacterium]
MLAKALYNALIYPLIAGGASIGGLLSGKLREGLEGRLGLTERAQRFRFEHPDARIVLFHCASAGELESIKPIALAFRKREWLSAVSYFSPSAKSSLRGSEFDFADYSPRDSIRSAGGYLGALKPNLVLISKHDVWPNMVWQSRHLGIPIWLINGNFHARSSKLFPVLKGFHRAIHRELTGILTVSEDDARRARLIAGDSANVIAVGDSRFDRVLARARAAAAPETALLKILEGKQVLVAGSTHEKDEHLLLASFAELSKSIPNLHTLIIPHDPSEAALRRIISIAKTHDVATSELTDSSDSINVSVINRSGVLAELYQVGHLAYVGGGFGRGVHSVIEPMAHGLEVVCGPNMGVSREALDAQAAGLLGVVDSHSSLVSQVVSRMCGPRRSEVHDFITRRSGVVDRILSIVLPQT